MATKSIPAVAPGVQVDFLPDGTTPAVSSVDVARHFQVKHKNVLRDIAVLLDKLPDSFTELKFEPSKYTDTTGRTLPAYLMDRNAFTLLVMGWSSKAALAWKLRYIEAFNALERAALERMQEAARLEGGHAALASAATVYDRITPERMEKVRKAVYYKAKDLSEREIAKLLDCHHRSVQNYLQDARALG